MSSTRAVIVGPAFETPAPARWLKRKLAEYRVTSRDQVVALDGGLSFLEKVGIEPDLRVGDWDSVPPDVLRRACRTRSAEKSLKVKKDRSDLAFALQELDPAGELILFGVTGCRPDHHLSNLLEIALFVSTNASRQIWKKVTAIGPEGEYHFITDHQSELVLSRRSGALISVFAIGKEAKGVSMKGFEYNLHRHDLAPGSGGLSNRVHAARASIRLTRGVLVAILPSGDAC